MNVRLNEAEGYVQLYYNGQWNNWVKSNINEDQLYNDYLYYLGTDYTDITGGWSGYAYKSSTSTASVLSAPTVEMGTSYMTWTEKSTDVGAVLTGYDIDLTEYKYIEIDYETTLTHSAGSLTFACIPTKTNNYTISKSVSITSTTRTIATLDISDLSGKYYLGGALYCTNCIIYSIKLVK